MSYTLSQLIEDCRTAVAEDSGVEGRRLMCSAVQKAVLDTEFVSEHLPSSEQQPRRVIYEDPDHGFCICAHVHHGANNSPPHDHGSTWAIYGQADGTTEMSDWDIVEVSPDGKSTKVKKGKSYALNPGDVHLYEVGDVHSPTRDGPTKLLRIEGADTTKLQRTPIELVD